MLYVSPVWKRGGTNLCLTKELLALGLGHAQLDFHSKLGFCKLRELLHVSRMLFVSVASETDSYYLTEKRACAAEHFLFNPTAI